MRLNVWKTKPMSVPRIAARSSSPAVETGLPSTVTSPVDGVSSPPIRFNSVLLPEPLGPMIAVYDPGSSVKLTESSAVTRLPTV